MPEIKTDHFSGGSNVTPKASSGKPGDDLEAMLRAAQADLAELRTQFIALLTKLDADTTLDESDYVSTLTPAALTLTQD